MKPILILGATSSIGRALALSFAEKGYSIYLAGRNAPELERIAADLRNRYQVEVLFSLYDADYLQENEKFLRQALLRVKGFAGVVIGLGEFGEQQRAVIHFPEAKKIIDRNFTNVCSVITHLANYLEKEKSGFILTISSTAAERGHRQNYIYGAAKAGLNVFLQGLRHRLSSTNIRVLTVKAALVDTDKTFGIEKWYAPISPKFLAEQAIKGLESGKQEIYVPWAWRYFMLFVRTLPERLYNKM